MSAIWGLLLTPGRASAFSAGVTSDMAMTFGRSIVERFDVDWASAGIVDDDLDQLVEFMLRIFQSLVIDPGRPPHTRAKNSRAFLRRWVAPAISISAPSHAPGQTKTKPTKRAALTTKTKAGRSASRSLCVTPAPCRD